MNKIPGASDLGWGFNIFGPYSDSSIKSQLFDQPAGDTWTDPITGTDYALPGNIAVSVLEQSSGFSRVFESRTEVQEFFAAKAGVEGSYVTEYGAFSGAFNSAYQKTVDRESSFTYALYEADNVAWQLALEAQSAAQLTQEVQAEIAALPDAFSTETRAAFFRFFDLYGTHYVSRVRVGGRLYYYIAVNKSYLSDETKIEADVTLEYNAVLVSAKGTAEVEWSQLTKAWADNRTVQIQAVGGSPDSLLLAAPVFDDNRSPIFSAWVESIKNAPATVDFDLRPVTVLFPAAKAGAVQDAMNAYFSDSLLVVESRGAVTDSSSQPSRLPVVILGTPVAPDVPAQHANGFQLLVMRPDGDDYSVVLDKYYSTQMWTSQEPYEAVFDRMLADVESGGYTQPGHILVLASYNWLWQAPPSEAFYAFLRSAGGGALLQSWMDISDPGSFNSTNTTYILVGATGSGPGTGVEAGDQGDSAVSTTIGVRLHGLDVQRINVDAAATPARLADAVTAELKAS